MDNIFSKLKEIDEEAAAISSHIAAEKEKLSAEYSAKTAAFDKESNEKAQTALNALQSSSDRKIDEELKSQSADTNKDIEELKSFYANNKEKMAGDIFKSVTGYTWEA